MDAIDDPHVHDEVRQIGVQIRREIERFRPATTAKGIEEQANLFGPSAESKDMLRRERTAAIDAVTSGIYLVYRQLSGKQTDDCFRVGPQTRCFCGHSLSDHEPLLPRNVSKRRLPRCTGCPCEAFAYVPNSPAEIGEHWISRRKGFDPSQWFPKCSCGHTTQQHDPVSKKCKACARCFRFTGQFGCLVCDSRYEEHATLLELESERSQEGRTVGEAFMPLHLAPDAARAVFGESSTVASCKGCASPFAKETSKFCSRCGLKR